GDRSADESLRNAGARRESAGRDAAEPTRVNFFRPLHAARGCATTLRGLDQTRRIRAVAAADDEYEVGVANHVAHRILAILGRVADVILWRRLDRRETRAKAGHDRASLGHAEGCLRDERDRRAELGVDRVDV